MSLLSVTIQHGRTKQEAAHRLETAVHEISAKLGRVVQRVDWGADRDRVKLAGVGFSIEMWVDDQAVHVTGDIPLLGRLLGSPVASQVKGILERTFQERLP